MGARSVIDRSPEFGRLWAQHEVAGYGTRNKIFNHPLVGQLQFRTMSLGLHGSPGLRMIVYLAADECTAEALGNLESRQAPLRLAPLPCGHRFTEAVSSE